MQVSFSGGLDDGRPVTAIGRIRATTRWRAAGEPGAEADRQAAIEALMREAEEYGADAVIDVRFEVDEVQRLRHRGGPASADHRDRPRGAVRARRLRRLTPRRGEPTGAPPPGGAAPPLARRYSRA